MKSILKIAVVAVMFISAVHAEDIICAKPTGDAFYRPVSPLAVDIAKKLKVKSCRGTKFKAVAKKLGKNVVERAMTAQEQTAYEKSLVDSIDTTQFAGR